MSLLKKSKDRKSNKYAISSREIDYLNYMKTIFSSYPNIFSSKTFGCAMSKCEAVCNKAIHLIENKPSESSYTCYEFSEDTEFKVLKDELSKIGRLLDKTFTIIPKQLSSIHYSRAISKCKKICTDTKKSLLKVYMDAKKNLLLDNSTTVKV